MVAAPASFSFVLLTLSIAVNTANAALSSSDAYTRWLNSKGKNYVGSKVFYKEAGTTENQAEDIIALHWTIFDENAAATPKIRLAVAVEASGWVGVGIAEMGGMAGSDILIFEKQQAKLYDAYGVAYERPKVDEQQDWTLLTAGDDSSLQQQQEQDGIIIFEAERDLVTGDPMDWPIVDDSNPTLSGTKLIFAWGNTEEMHYHGPDNRMQGWVRFFDPDSDSQALFQQYVSSTAEGSVHLKLDNFEVPNKWTTMYAYRCFTAAELAKEYGVPMDKTLHITGFETVKDPATLVHHIVLYTDTSEKITNCDPSGPSTTMYVWNKGSDVYTTLPNDVGMLLSDGSQAGAGLGAIPKSFRLEIHYENPKRIKGSKDSSGIRLYFTTQLRKHTGAIMMLGDPRVGLRGKPIGEGLQRHVFDCPATCTNNHIPKEGVTVLYEILHMHQHGQTMQNVQKRQGTEVRRSSVQFFDFNQGGIRIAQEPYQILPGDTFETLCHYNGTNTLSFGFQADKEMCMAWVFYYPALNVDVSCEYGARTKGCKAAYSTVPVKNFSLLGRTFGQISPGQPKKSATAAMAEKNAVYTKTHESGGASSGLPKKGTPGSSRQKNPSSETTGKGATSQIVEDSEKTEVFVKASLATGVTCALMFAVIAVIWRMYSRRFSNYKKLSRGNDDERLEEGAGKESAYNCPIPLKSANGNIRRRG